MERWQRLSGKHLERGKLCSGPSAGKVGFWVAQQMTQSRTGLEVGKIVWEGGNEGISFHGIEVGHTLGTMDSMETTER